MVLKAAYFSVRILRELSKCKKENKKLKKRINEKI